MDGAQVSKEVILAMATYTSCTFRVLSKVLFCWAPCTSRHACMDVVYLSFLCLHEEESGWYVPLVWRRAKTPWLEACNGPAMRE